MKFIYPLVSFLLSVGIQLIFMENAAVFIVWIFIYLPLTSFFYSKRFLKGGKSSIPYTLIHSFSLSFSYLMLYFSEEGSYGVAVLLFLWCEVWALLGLIRKEKMPIFFKDKLFERHFGYKKCTEKSRKRLKK